MIFAAPGDEKTSREFGNSREDAYSHSAPGACPLLTAYCSLFAPSPFLPDHPTT